MRNFGAASRRVGPLLHHIATAGGIGYSSFFLRALRLASPAADWLCYLPTYPYSNTLATLRQASYDGGIISCHDCGHAGYVQYYDELTR